MQNISGRNSAEGDGYGRKSSAIEEPGQVCNVCSVFYRSAVEKCRWLGLGRVVTIPSLALLRFSLSDWDVYVCIRLFLLNA
jgi:hypothetical protein